MIGVVDYGVGNLGSVLNMFKRVGVPARLVATPDELVAADKLLLPGVGAFDHAMQRLNESGLRSTLDARVLEDKVPLLGICLGMQLLARSSEEGVASGLGYVPADVKRFPADTGLKVPHMGWNAVDLANPCPLFPEGEVERRFYFVHSYFAEVDAPEYRMLTCTYGRTFDAGIMKDNVFGVQFHPEKSHRFGKALFSAFGAL